MGRAVAVCAVLFGISLASSDTAFGQEVRGTVREIGNRQPIAGAVVVLLDSSSKTLGRNITDERGRYRVVVSTATTQLRFLRIGFRPATVQLRRSAATIDTVDVLMTALPTMLEPMKVSANACPRRDDAGQALGLLEQARASLLNSVVAREASPGSAVRLRFQRMMDGTSDRIARQTVRVDSVAQSESPFASVRSGSQFVHDGFTKDDVAGITFYAPDADALLDDAFIAGYCFRLIRADRDHPTEVGLGFYAASRARSRVDIDGVLWVDTTARQLRRLEFGYVGLDRSLDPARPGGRLSFREMANGVVIIDRWSLRLPVVSNDSVAAGYSPSCVGESCFNAYTLRGRLDAQETGGEVARISWPTGLVWDAPLGALRLTALTHARLPAAGTLVRLEDTDYSGRVGANGEVTLDRLLPGPYELVVLDSLLQPLGITLQTPVRFEAARDSIHRATIDVPTAEDFVFERCRHDGNWKDFSPRKRPGAVWVLGRVVGPERLGLDRMRARLSSPFASLTDKDVTSTRTGTDGVFELCQSQFVVGDSVIVGILDHESMASAFRFFLTDSLTVLPLIKAPKRP
jgi:Carboxypeptidase regulatory-like domain